MGILKILIKKLQTEWLLNNLLVVLIVTPAFFSCSKKVTGTSSTTYTREEIEIEEINFQYLSMKSKIEFEEAGNKKNATALIRIKKDSVIWFNLSGTLGVQGLRGMLTRDSIKMINRVDKEYYIMDYKQLSKEFNFNIDFQLLQAMILGEMPKGKQEGETITKEGNSYIIHQGFGDIYIDNYISATTKKVNEVQVFEINTENSLKLLYGDFRQIEDHLFPYSSFISLIHTNEFGELETRVTIKHNKIHFSDKELKFPYAVPKKYVKK